MVTSTVCKVTSKAYRLYKLNIEYMNAVGMLRKLKILNWIFQLTFVHITIFEAHLQCLGIKRFVQNRKKGSKLPHTLSKLAHDTLLYKRKEDQSKTNFSH